MRISKNAIQAFPGIAACLVSFVWLNFWKMSKVNQCGNKQKDSGDDQIRHFYRVCFRCYVRLQLLRAHGRSLRRRVLDSGKYEGGSKRGDKRSTHGVEGLRKIQPAFRSLGGAEHGHIRVGTHLQKRLPGRHHKQRKQEESIYSGTRGRNKQQCPSGADEQSEQNASFVADLFHEPAGGKSSQEITAKKGNLDKGRLKVREVECFLKMRDKHVIQVDTDGPQKKQASDKHERK